MIFGLANFPLELLSGRVLSFTILLLHHCIIAMIDKTLLSLALQQACVAKVLLKKHMIGDEDAIH